MKTKKKSGDEEGKNAKTTPELLNGFFSFVSKTNSREREKKKVLAATAAALIN
jgi:hypothetical protein